jgi:hypothetical protein
VKTEIAGDQCHAGPPGSVARILVDEVPQYRGHFREATLLTADREHLYAIDAVSIFAAELSPRLECPLCQALGFGEFPAEDRPHGVGTDVEVEMIVQVVPFEALAVPRQHDLE